MSRFSESVGKVDKPVESRVSKNLVVKKEAMVTRSIRISERDMKILEDHFQEQERTFTQGIRLIVKEYMESKELL